MSGFQTGYFADLSERHPPKQGLKLFVPNQLRLSIFTFRATSTKTRIETQITALSGYRFIKLSERHPPKQGLKRRTTPSLCHTLQSFRATSTKTRIETERQIKVCQSCLYFQSDIHQNKD